MAKLYFTGKIDPSLTPASASLRLAQLFKTNDTSPFATWFTGNPVIIKDNIDLTSAQQYQTLFAQQGIFLEISKPELNPQLNAIPPLGINNPNNPSPSGFYPATNNYSSAYADENILEDDDNDEDLSFWAKVWKNYFSPKGRITRFQYWSRALAIPLVTFFTVFILIFLAGLLGISTNSGLAILIAFIPIIASIIIGLISNHALMSKRLHDSDFTGWWSILIYIPFVNFFIIYLRF